jgi:hypothetical protein
LSSPNSTKVAAASNERTSPRTTTERHDHNIFAARKALVEAETVF